MSLFAVFCRDKPDQLQTRLDAREAHLGFLRASETRVKMAGPLIEDGQMRGSLIVIEAKDLDDAQRWSDQDPYATSGLFKSVEITEWNKVIG